MSTMNLDRVRVLTHSSIRIQTAAGTVVYFDPYNMRDAAHDADIICITHAHYDHFSPKDIARAARQDTQLVVPASMAGEAPQAGLAAIHTMQPGDSLRLADVELDAVPAYNVQPERLGFHPKSNAWLGYVLAADDMRYYVAGDTDQNPDNMQIPCDVTLVPIGGTFTMDPAQAAAFVNVLQPRAAIPTHYGSVAGKPEDAEAFAALVDPSIQVAIKTEQL
ncbi:MBL fold metallo-hydrolase [Collinsella sp. An2]|uniref:MBL fold metallo-hydrolase n=1 Tax=Collinsella sp. An2 TaxID=1965585 RepID=UPI001EF56C72|nr:MBL fold metallo-hydrolase [Collinsella sp. An2]